MAPAPAVPLKKSPAGADIPRGMRGLAAWGAIAAALAAGYALEVVALRVRQGTDLAAVASAILLAAAIGALARRLHERRVAAAPADAGGARVAAATGDAAALARLGHELRAPLHAIVSHADALAAEAVTEAQRTALAAIRRNSDHLLALVVRALDAPAAATPVQVACRPADLVGDAVATLRAAAAAKGLALTVDCPAPVPVSVLADATGLQQVLLNLLDNAVKFTERGAVRLAVELVETPHTVLRFVVRDTGPGIPEAEHQTIFEPHRRGIAARLVPGRGLGLAIARDLVQAMGGRLAVESRPGSGSAFTATVPVHVDATTPRVVIDLATPARRGPATCGRRLDGRVLLVEDAADVRGLLAHTLERAGADVEAVGTGSEGLGRALAAGRAHRAFDLILMDMQLPGLDGDEVVRRLRRAGCETPVVALTAAAGPDARDRCLAAGCTDYLAKPVGLDALVATVERHLSGAADGAPLASTLPRDAGLDGIVESFVGLLERHVREIEHAAGSGDAAAVGRLAHRLRGAAGSHGFAPISDAALALEETAATGGNLTPALLLLARLCRRAAAAHAPRPAAPASVADQRPVAPVALGLESVLGHES